MHTRPLATASQNSFFDNQGLMLCPLAWREHVKAEKDSHLCPVLSGLQQYSTEGQRPQHIVERGLCLFSLKLSRSQPRNLPRIPTAVGPPLFRACSSRNIVFTKTSKRLLMVCIGV
jgi:hypothetical protein